MLNLGYPYPTVSWTREDGSAVVTSANEDRFKLDTNNDETVLSISKVAIVDSGKYFVEVKNERGRVNKAVKVSFVVNVRLYKT